MHEIDKTYTTFPYYGMRRMQAHLVAKGFSIGKKRVQRLMAKMGLKALFPGKKRRLPQESACIYPYRLRYLLIDKPNQVWATDITYIRLQGGFIYLIAIMDLFSRYVISWRLSESLETAFCLDALHESLTKATPVFFNTDQGVQFTSKDFTQILLHKNIRISMAGKGRCFDNIFVERLWRSLKYEDIYFKNYASMDQAKDGIATYWTNYNTLRRHQALAYLTPQQAFTQYEAFKDQLSPIYRIS